MPDYTDPSVAAPGLAALNDRLDHGDIKQLGCTSAAKINSKGELIFGRNMDLEISQDPLYVYRTTYGKYSNFCATYSPGGYLPYAEVQKLNDLDDWSGTTVRASSGTHANPYNQILFQDDKGNPQFDWRGDFVQSWPVLSDGCLVLPAETYEIAKKSDYDPQIKEYLDEAIACGTLALEDEFMVFSINGDLVSLSEMRACNEAIELSDDPQRQIALSQAYQLLLDRCNSRWVHDDRNFEALKAAVYARQHIRYDKNGMFDPSCMSKYEKLLAFYGIGCEKDEKPLRDDANIWTTSMNFGVNCTKKKLKARLWENNDVVLEVRY